MKIKMNNARLAFPVLFNAKAVNDGKPAFSASLLLQDDDPQIKTIHTRLKEIACAKWGEKADAILKGLIAHDKVCLHDGDFKSDYDGFEGSMYVSARNPSRPLVIGRDLSPITESDGVIYGGCYVNASVELWAQDNQFGKRINATLRGVQFLRDGDAFSGGGSSSVDEFDSFDDGDDTSTDREGGNKPAGTINRANDLI